MVVKAQITPRTIVRNPQILLGEPTVEGTRIAVRHVVLYRLGDGSIEGVLSALPALSRVDVETALRFYREHCDESTATDDEQIRYASARGWGILSTNERRFFRWHHVFRREKGQHAGIIIVQQSALSFRLHVRCAMMLDRIDAELPAPHNMLFRWLTSSNSSSAAIASRTIVMTKSRWRLAGRPYREWRGRCALLV